MKIGVISDTHDYFNPKVPKLFAGVDHIIHAGDVGRPWILLELEQIAPVTAVLGNSDSFLTLKEMELVELKERKIAVRHIVDPQNPGKELQSFITRTKPDVVVFGHTHKRFCLTLGGILYFNPGYAGNKPDAAERSVAILQWDEKEIRSTFLDL